MKISRDFHFYSGKILVTVHTGVKGSVNAQP